MVIQKRIAVEADIDIKDGKYGGCQAKKYGPLFSAQHSDHQDGGQDEGEQQEQDKGQEEQGCLFLRCSIGSVRDFLRDVQKASRSITDAEEEIQKKYSDTAPEEPGFQVFIHYQRLPLLNY